MRFRDLPTGACFTLSPTERRATAKKTGARSMVLLPGGRPAKVTAPDMPVRERPCRFTLGRKRLAWRELSGYKCRRYTCAKSNFGHGKCGGKKGWVRRCADFGPKG